jgi:hypothetical protein
LGLPIVSLGVLIVIQHTQTHDDRAMQLKLDELIRAVEGASMRLVGAEEEDWDDLNDLQQRSRDQSLDGARRWRASGERASAAMRPPPFPPRQRGRLREGGEPAQEHDARTDAFEHAGQLWIRSAGSKRAPIRPNPLPAWISLAKARPRK